MLLETADSVFLFSLFPIVAFCLLGFVFILLDIQQPLKSLNLLLGKPGHQFFKQGSSLHPCTVTSEILTTGIWKPMDLAFTAQLSSRTSISGSQLSAPEFPSAISQFITLFFSYTEVQCVKSSFCFNFVSQDLINYIFAKVKYTHFNMSNNTKEPHIHTHPSALGLALASPGPGPFHLSGTRLLLRVSPLQTHRGLSLPFLCPSFRSQKDIHVSAAAASAFSVLKCLGLSSTLLSFSFQDGEAKNMHIKSMQGLYSIFFS